MTDFGELMGTLLASVSHARRIADEESAAIAEYYKDDPLLSTMSVPRIRVPELTIDLPIYLESHEGKVDQILKPKKEIQEKVMGRLNQYAKQEKVQLSEKFIQIYGKELDHELTLLENQKKMKKIVSREKVIHSSDRAFRSALKNSPDTPTLKPAQIKKLQAELRHVAGSVSIAKEGIPPKIKASILTADIKDKAAPANIARVKITLKEEGLEWSSTRHEDGSTRNHLTPE